ncbi:DASH family cryptochrome [Flavilitoribacter nigricans]|uniref:Cryptochrome DASH n=1 Tax=Flavilitoribacter nigricans (strain ATCC 23147 / DSM 23189 / NBRC 102662 / NCIMB 1420 / SS-2) TaxID=1122177 RepID=A0A2D0N1E1_FLAN2|nr:DASH family cryptochrome [Flavilitoribacter nigricans]PHN02198.1 DASH family cryptochrome [Flavilitoribacter nigricans DSM 23189 = NBRC 102662]
MSSKISIYWLRNDLRLHDNEALHLAISNASNVLPVYCFDPRHYRLLELGFRKTGIHRFRFLCACLTDLKKQLQEKGSDLMLAVGQPEQIIPELVIKYEASAVYAQKEIASEETEVEAGVKKALEEQGVPLHLVWGKTLYHLDDIPYTAQEIPLTSKAFRINVGKATEPRDLFSVPTTIPTVNIRDWGALPSSDAIGYTEVERAVPAQNIYQGGERQALQRLQYYTFESQLLTNYKFTRNRSLGLDYSSKFSPWMAHGCLSPRKIYHTVKQYEVDIKRNISTWWLVFEVVWRDFFKFQALRFGNLMFAEGGIRKRKVSWQYDEALFDRWKDGKTGIPFLDAHMKELQQTGFMSNRGRVNAASFLTRDYQIDWRWGAAWFENLLLDYDVCSNWLNWNTQATEIWYTNPVHQAMKYDKKGRYTLYWLPELARLPYPLYHAPWLLTEEERAKYGVKDYLEPVEIYGKWNRSISNIKKAFQEGSD